MAAAADEWTDLPSTAGDWEDVTETPVAADDERPAFLNKKAPPTISTPFKVTGGPRPLEGGNVDLRTRPQVKNPDGTTSTVRSMSFQETPGGPEILVPTVSDEGKVVSDEEAIALHKRTGRHLGKFKTPEEATAYADRLHRQQEAAGVTPETRPFRNTGANLADQLRAEAAAAAAVKTAESRTLGQRVSESLSGLGRTVVGAVQGAGEMVSPIDRHGKWQNPNPFARLTEGLTLDPRDHGDPSRGAHRRQLLRGASDAITAGWAERAGSAVDPRLRATEESDAEAAPGVRELGAVGGSFAPSPFRLIGGKAAAAIPGTGALATAGRNLAAYEGQAVSQALAATGSPEAALDVATDPVGAGLATLPVLAGAGLRRVASGAKDRKVVRAASDIEEGATKPAKARLRDKGDELLDVLRRNDDLVDNIEHTPSPKSDARLLEAAGAVGKRAGKTINDFMEARDAGDLPPLAAPARSAVDLDAVPMPIGEERTVQLKVPNFRASEPGGLVELQHPVPRDMPETPRSLDVTQRLQVPNFETDGLAPRQVTPERGYVPGPPVDVEPPPIPASPDMFRSVSQGGRLPPPSGSVAASENLFEAARAADAQAARVMLKAERHGRRAQEFVNKEMSAAESRKAALAEVQAQDLRQQAIQLRARAERLEGRTMPQGTPEGSTLLKSSDMPETFLEPEIISSEPAPTTGGTRPADAIANMDRSIARLSKGSPNEWADAKALQAIRDEFAAKLGADPDAVISTRQMRDAQSDYQRHGYARTIPGMPDADVTAAKTRAYRQASKDVGDVVIKHVTGMSYPEARAFAEANPTSKVAEFLRANDDVSVSKRIEGLVQTRKGTNQGAPHRLVQILGRNVKSAATTALLSQVPVIGKPLAGAYGTYALGRELAPYAARAVDAAALRLAPPGRAPSSGASSAAIARLVIAARAGASRAQLQAQAERDGIEPSVVDRLASEP